MFVQVSIQVRDEQREVVHIHMRILSVAQYDGGGDYEENQDFAII